MGHEARLLSGLEASQRLTHGLAKRVGTMKKKGLPPPCLGVILVGDHPASQIYVKRKCEKASEIGIQTRVFTLPETASQDDVTACLTACNQDASLHGILLQLPLPAGLETDPLLAQIAPEKDVDGLHPLNQGRLAAGDLSGFSPCTPLGCLLLLRENEIEVAGQHVVIVGRSRLVGRPLATLLLAHDATVTIVHSRTPDLAALTRQADIVIVAAGKRHLITPDHISASASVIDVGIHRDSASGQISGDVDPALALKADALSPVPGGVGPMTVISLMVNTVEAAARYYASKGR